MISDDDKFEHEDGLLEFIRRQNDEKARFLIERGGMEYRHWEKQTSKKFPSIIGDGTYARIFRATVGGSSKRYLYAQRKTDEEKFPEIYPWKREKKWKRSARGLAQENVVSPEATYMSAKEFINLYSAISFTNGFGVALNVHVTINWAMLGYTDHEAAAKQLHKGFINPLAAWYGYTIQRFYDRFNFIPPQLFWVYVHENSQRIGFHTHFLVGIPREIIKEFRAWARERVKSLSLVESFEKKCIEIVSPPSHPIERQWRFFQYLGKGVDPRAMVSIEGYAQPVPLTDLIENRASSPGRIECKIQVGISRNLNRKARSHEKFLSWMEQGIFDKRKLYTSNLYNSWFRDRGDLTEHALQKILTALDNLLN